MEITNEQILELNTTINSVKDIAGTKFAYILELNREKIESKVLALQAALKSSTKNSSEEYKEFETKQMKLIELYGKRDDDNNLVLQTAPSSQITYTIDLDRLTIYNSKLQKLKKEYANAISSQELLIKEFETLLKEKTDIQFETLELNNFPNELNNHHMRTLKFMVKKED